MTLDYADSPTLEALPKLREGDPEGVDDLDSLEHFWFDRAWRSNWAELPQMVDPEAPATARRLRDVVAWTDWSNRYLADLLGTTHPTIAAVLRGQEITRLPDLRDRIARMHRVVQRLAALSDWDRSEVLRLLETRHVTEKSAAELMAARQFGKAYLVALDVRRPLPADGLMGSDFPARRTGTVPIEDLDE